MSAVVTDREIKVLEFDRIRLMLASMTVSPMAKERAENLEPSDCFAAVSRMQRETGEGRLLCAKNAFNPSVIEDILPHLNRALKGAMLSGAELAAVISFLKALRRWKDFFKNRDHCELYPLLA